MSSVVKPKHFKVKKTLDIVTQKTNFVYDIDTGTTTHCFLKESNVEKSRNVDVGINVMSPNGGRHTIHCYSRSKTPPRF